jgi:hypothetical protein
VASVSAALLVACSAYEDGDLRQLRAPAQDVERLATVLSDPAIGAFEVKTLLNQPTHVLNLAIEDFFADRSPDDLLLLYVSCHGVKDDDGRLYFAAGNTRLARLGATAVAAAFVNEQMTRSRSRRIVVLLDCCYSGAFPKGFLARGDKRIDIKGPLDGRGRAILTASSAMEYSFEGDRLHGEGMRSVFTGALVEGLETGMADLDLDGRVSVDELYDYVFDKVRNDTPKQTPGKWITDVQGKLYIAKAKPRELPADLQRATESPSPDQRAAAVEKLAQLLGGGTAAYSAAARQALQRLADDDSRRVSAAAAAALTAVEVKRRSRRASWLPVAVGAGLLAVVGLSALGVYAVTSGGGTESPAATTTSPATTTRVNPATTTPISTPTTARPRPPELVGDKKLNANERRLFERIPTFFAGGGTCSRMTAATDPRDIRPEEAAANLQCSYLAGATVVYSLFRSDEVMHDFFKDRLKGRGLAPGYGQFGPDPDWQLSYCRDPARGTGQIYGKRNTDRPVDPVRAEIGWIRDGYQMYAYAYRPSDDFAGLFAWWWGAYGPVDAHRC